jgi:hypothetical protein
MTFMTSMTLMTDMIWKIDFISFFLANSFSFMKIRHVTLKNDEGMRTPTYELQLLITESRPFLYYDVKIRISCVNFIHISIETTNSIHRNEIQTEYNEMAHTESSFLILLSNSLQ